MQIYITHPNEVIAKPLLQLAQEQKQQNIRATEKLERAPMQLAIAIYHNEKSLMSLAYAIYSHQ